MGRQSVAPLWEKLVPAAPIALGSNRPTTVADGVDISSWRSSSATPPYAMAIFDGDQTINLSAPAGGTGVELWGWIGKPGSEEWKLLGTLNNGNGIKINGASQGYAEEIYHSGVATRLCLVATKDIGSPTYQLVPLETWGLT